MAQATPANPVSMVLGGRKVPRRQLVQIGCPGTAGFTALQSTHFRTHWTTTIQLVFYLPAAELVSVPGQYPIFIMHTTTAKHDPQLLVL